MTVVLVHGVPETAAVWQPLIERLDADEVATVALPGFGCPVPDGFGATKDGYAAWLANQLEAMGEPVDLVGHDWGGILTNRLVATRPDLVRTRVTDCPAVIPEWEWHQTAVIWQTPEVGEQFMEQWAATGPTEMAEVFVAAGVPRAAAVDMMRAVDETMRGCILTLYRSAVDVGREWDIGSGGIDRPGLVVHALDDPFRPEGSQAALAERAGADLTEMPGCGHWWMLQDPDEAARRLHEFWAAH